MKISEQFLSISYNLAYRIKNTWKDFINFLQPYLSHQKISAVCVNFLQHYLSDWENLNSFYQFLITLLIKSKNLQQFLAVSYTPPYRIKIS